MPKLNPSGQGAVTGVSLTGGPPGLLLQKQAQFETEDPLERKRLYGAPSKDKSTHGKSKKRVRKLRLRPKSAGSVGSAGSAGSANSNLDRSLHRKVAHTISVAQNWVRQSPSLASLGTTPDELSDSFRRHMVLSTSGSCMKVRTLDESLGSTTASMSISGSSRSKGMAAKRRGNNSNGVGKRGRLGVQRPMIKAVEPEGNDIVANREDRQQHRREEDGKDELVKSVSFGNIEINEHDIILGNHPCVSSGPPIMLSWQPRSQFEFTVDDYEEIKPESKVVPLPADFRESFLSTDGYTHRELEKAIRDANVTKRERRRTVNMAHTEWVQEITEGMQRSLRKKRRSADDPRLKDILHIGKCFDRLLAQEMDRQWNSPRTEPSQMATVSLSLSSASEAPSAIEEDDEDEDDEDEMKIRDIIDSQD